MTFVGISDKHFAQCPMVLNPRTRAITTPYHVVFDDWFATVGSSMDDIPDFQSPEWQQLFGDSTYQFVPPEPLEFDSSQFDSKLAATVAARRQQVADAMARDTSMSPHSGLDAPTQPTPAEERENKWLQHRQRQPQASPPIPPSAPTVPAPSTPMPVVPDLPTTTVKAEPTHIEVANDVEMPPTPVSTPTPRPRQSRMMRASSPKTKQPPSA